jgi:hypothetical protein
METEKLFVFFFYCKKYNKTNIRLSKFFKSNKVVLKDRVKFLIKNKSTKQFFNNKNIVFLSIFSTKSNLNDFILDLGIEVDRKRGEFYSTRFELRFS